MPLGRISIAVIAIMACAWFVLGSRQAHDLNAATAIVTNGTPTRAQASHAASLLDTAATLNPDTEVKLVRAALLSEESRQRRATALVRQVVAAEPANAVAWQELARVDGSNTQVAFMALQHVRELVPPIRRTR